MVLQERIELSSNPYHGFVLPLNYRSVNTCMHFITQLNFDQIPAHLLLTRSQIEEQLHRVTLYQSNGDVYDADWYRVYTCNDALMDYIKHTMPFDVQYVEYVISDRAIPMHRDLGRVRALNYVLETGGVNVATKFYNDDKRVMLEYVCDTHTWYELNVGAYHSVAEPQPNPRFLLSVTPQDGVTYLLEDVAKTGTPGQIRTDISYSSV